MLEIKHQSITSESGEVTAVIIDIDTFKKMEAIIEDYGLSHFMKEAETSDLMNPMPALESILDEIDELGMDDQEYLTPIDDATLEIIRAGKKQQPGPSATAQQ